MGHPWKNKVACPDCGKVVKNLAQHQKMAHGKEVAVSKEGGKEMTEEEIKAAVDKALAEKEKAQEVARSEESEKSGIAESIKGIGERLDKIDSDFCSKFPELCQTVSELKEAMPKKPEEGSEEWKTETRSGLEHVLFDDCPNCTPLREEVLAAKGKRLADVEAEAKVEESKVEDETKVDETETKVDEEGSELKTSPGYFPGSKWDDEKGYYVEARGE